MTTTVRACSDPVVKQFMNTRAKTVHVLLTYGVDLARARQKEYEIYRRAHTSVDVYLNVAVSMLRRLTSEAPSGSSGGSSSGGSSSGGSGGSVSSAKLQSFFHINWTDILSEEARFSLAQCAKCRSREIYAVTAQLRSADEGMSVLCTCQRCGESWKER